MDPREIMQELQSISDSCKSLGDKLKSLSTKSEDVDVVSLITALSMQSYDLAVNIQESVDTYKEILEEDMEDITSEEEIVPEDEDLEPVDPEG